MSTYKNYRGFYIVLDTPVFSVVVFMTELKANDSVAPRDKAVLHSKISYRGNNRTHKKTNGPFFRSKHS